MVLEEEHISLFEAKNDLVEQTLLFEEENNRIRVLIGNKTEFIV